MWPSPKILFLTWQSPTCNVRSNPVQGRPIPTSGRGSWSDGTSTARSRTYFEDQVLPLLSNMSVGKLVHLLNPSLFHRWNDNVDAYDPSTFNADTFTSMSKAQRKSAHTAHSHPTRRRQICDNFSLSHHYSIAYIYLLCFCLFWGILKASLTPPWNDLTLHCLLNWSRLYRVK